MKTFREYLNEAQKYGDFVDPEFIDNQKFDKKKEAIFKELAKDISSDDFYFDDFKGNYKEAYNEVLRMYQAKTKDNYFKVNRAGSKVALNRIKRNALFDVFLKATRTL